MPGSNAERQCDKGMIRRMNSRLFGLIPAAGAGQRLGATIPKQYLPLAGHCMLWHSVQALLCEPSIDSVFVVLSPEDGWFRQQDWSAFGERLAPLYCGGATRRDSVHNGLMAASSVIDEDDWVLVHDAARPCLTQTDLLRLIAQVCAQAGAQASDDASGGILALPVADTLKSASTSTSMPISAYRPPARPECRRWHRHSLARRLAHKPARSIAADRSASDRAGPRHAPAPSRPHQSPRTPPSVRCARCRGVLHLRNTAAPDARRRPTSPADETSRPRATAPRTRCRWTVRTAGPAPNATACNGRPAANTAWGWWHQGADRRPRRGSGQTIVNSCAESYLCRIVALRSSLASPPKPVRRGDNRRFALRQTQPASTAADHQAQRFKEV